MKEIWTKTWKKALIWLCGYSSFIAYALVGGYVIVKSDDEELKKTAKTAFIVTLIFTALSAILLLYNYCGRFAGDYYNSAAYNFYVIFDAIVAIARIVVFAFFIIMTFVKNKKVILTAPRNRGACSFKRNTVLPHFCFARSRKSNDYKAFCREL